MTAIRYWSDSDQRHSRLITFSSVEQALEMLAFYQGAGFRCELAWDFFLLLSSSGAVGLSVTLPLKTWQRPWTSVTHNSVRLIRACASHQTEHQPPTWGFFIAILWAWTTKLLPCLSLTSLLNSTDAFLWMKPPRRMQQWWQHWPNSQRTDFNSNHIASAKHGI